MARNSTGSWDGKKVQFELTDTELRIDFEGDNTSETINTAAIIAIIDKFSGDELDVHMFKSSVKDEWKPKSLFYEKHTAQGLPPSLVKQLHISQFPKPLLSSHANSSLWVCISTRSGTGEAKLFFDNALGPLLEALEINVTQKLETTSSESITDFCRDTILPNAKHGTDQTIILLSGDGGPIDMVNALTASLDESQFKVPTLCLIPLGTGNALAHSSGLTKDSTVGLRSLLQGTAQPIPAFEAHFSPGARIVVDEGQGRKAITSEDSTTKPTAIYGAVVCSWGFHASLVADSDTVEYRKFGAERFKLAAQELLAPSDGSAPHAYRGRVSVWSEDGTERNPIGESEHAYTLLTLASNLEQGFTISPESRPLDGQLRLVHFGPLPADDVMRIMGLAYQGGQHVHDPAVHYEIVKGMRIDFEEEEERWRRVCIDGKIIAVEKGGWVEVKPGPTVLNLIAPEA